MTYLNKNDNLNDTKNDNLNDNLNNTKNDNINDNLNNNKDDKVKKKLFLDTVVIIGFIIYLYLSTKTEKIDFVINLYFILIAIVYFIGRIINNTTMIRVFHVLWACIMVFLPLITNNNNLLYIHIIYIIITLVSRKIFKGCAVRTLEKYDKNYKTISNNVFSNSLNWDYIFTIIGIISTTRLYINTN